MITEAELAAVLTAFRAEADDLLAEMERSLEVMRAQPDDPVSLQAVFRVVHTLKGAGASLGFASLAAFAHRLEDLLDRLRARALPSSAEVVDLLNESHDALGALVAAALDPGKPTGALVPEVLSRIGLLLGRQPDAVAADITTSPTAGQAQAQASLRVAIAKLDEMLDVTGEIFIARGRLAALLEAGAPLEALRDAHADSDRLYLQLQDSVLKARMIPIGPSFRRQARLVREVAILCGKQATLELDGDEVEMDTAVVEALAAPLAHMIRNAIDHGLEAPEVRRARGKPAEGTIALRARHEGPTVIIEVSDDGAGLDRASLISRGRALGLLEEGELRPGELERLVFEPGLSTAGEVSELSGRGVGMDVVRRNIEALRGTVDVEDSPGQGCAFIIRLPLTLAIIRGLGVRAGDESFVIPLDAVRECVDLPPGADRDGHAGMLNLRGRVLPYLRLRQHFATGGRSSQREQVVLVKNGAGLAGIAVDEVEGEAPSVIKPLGKVFEGLPGISASTIRADGRVSLILDVPGLLRHALLRSMRSINN